MCKGIKALFAGLLAGATLGILFAPKKGKDLRQGLRKEIDEGGTGLKTFRSTCCDMREDMEETAKDVAEEVKKSPKYKKGKRKVKRVAKKVASEAKKKAGKSKE